MSLFAPKIKPGEKICPYVGTPCLKHSCEMYIKVEGSNPQTGKPMDVWTCAIKEVPTFSMYIGASIQKLDGEMSAFRKEQRSAFKGFTEFFDFVKGVINGSENIGRGPNSPMVLREGIGGREQAGAKPVGYPSSTSDGICGINQRTLR